MMTEEEFDSMLARALTGNNEPQTEMHDLRTEMYAVSNGGYNYGNFTLLVTADGKPLLYEPQTEREGE